MTRMRIALAATALVASGAFAAPVAASSSTYYISQSGGAAGVGNGTSCASPDVLVDNAGVYFNDAMDLILADLDTSANTTIVVCASASEYEMDWDTNPTDFNDGDGNQTITIQGSTSNRADTQIDGNNQYSPIDIKDANLVVRNLTIDDARDDSSGGAIHLLSQDDLTLTATLVNIYVWDANTTATGSDGAGAYIAGNLIASNVYFEASDADDYGGAIYVEGNATISNSRFENNESDDEDGGAVYVAGNATVTRSTFVDNHTDDNGGALYVLGDARISSSLFTGNHTHDDDGGAINGVGALTVTGSTFIDNDADSEGGAINAEACDTVTITANTFLENYADSSGGAVNIDGCDEELDDPAVEITFLRNRFESNWAFWAGGAVDIDDSDLTVLFRANRFQDNFSEADWGGAIWLHSARLLGNSFSSNSAQCGGAVYVQGDLFGTQKFNGFRNNFAWQGSRARNVGNPELCEGPM